MPEFSDAEVANVRQLLKSTAVKKTLIPRQQWIALADHYGRSAQEIAQDLDQVIQWGALELGPAKDLAQAASDLLPEIEKLRQIVRDCMYRADRGDGTAAQFLHLALAGHELSQELRLRMIAHYALSFTK